MRNLNPQIIKTYRCILQDYAGDECHWYGPPRGGKGSYLQIYKNEDHEWPIIKANVLTLLEENGVTVEIEDKINSKMYNALKVTINISLHG